MKREIKEAWLKRLESPKAKKARHMLHNPKTGGMCCLGHLMAVCGIAEDDFSKNSFGKDGVMPSDAFLHRMGLRDHCASHLASLNDSMGGFPLAAIRALPVED